MTERAVDPELIAFVVDVGLAPPGAAQTWTPLSGGVSSDIWRLDCAGRSLCIKRALAQLRVAADWTAPVGRSLYEWRWFETVDALFPGSAPRPVALDEARGALAMDFLEPASHPLWKAQLLAGQVDVAFAAKVGARLGQIHAATARRADIAERFATDSYFLALRLDPYLLATAERRPEAAGPLRALVERTAGLHLALVHGDVSPKNILAGPAGPVFLDAETAWYGDPAFDLAFCLNHLLLKRLVVPQGAAALAASVEALAEAYFAQADWEPRVDLEARAASLLPGLLLARVDGKSPVEYLTRDDQKDTVRAAAIPLLLEPVATLAEVQQRWIATR